MNSYLSDIFVYILRYSNIYSKRLDFDVCVGITIRRKEQRLALWWEGITEACSIAAGSPARIKLGLDVVEVCEYSRRSYWDHDSGGHAFLHFFLEYFLTVL